MGQHPRLVALGDLAEGVVRRVEGRLAGIEEELALVEVLFFNLPQEFVVAQRHGWRSITENCQALRLFSLSAVLYTTLQRRHESPMQFTRNSTGMPAALTVTADKDARDYAVVVVKG